MHHREASQSGPAEEFAFPPLDQMGSLKKSHKSTFSVSGPGSLVGDRPSGGSHKVTSSLPRPSPNRAGTLYDTAATRAAKAGISLSLVDSAATSGASEHVRPRSSLTRLDQARQEAGGETPRAVKEAKSRFENGAAPERRTVDVHAIQLVVDQPKLPTLSSPTKARAAASQQPPRQASPTKGQSAVDAEFERKLLAAMEGGINPFLDKRKATMRGAPQTSTSNPPTIADEWGVMAPDATPRRAAQASTLPSPVRQTPQQQKPLYVEEDSATPRAARALQREVASPYSPPSVVADQQTSLNSQTMREPVHKVAQDEQRSQPVSPASYGDQQMKPIPASSDAQSPLRSPSKRIDSFLDASDDGPSTKELTAKLSGLQIEYKSLQQKLQGAQEDAQGWQSEALRLETELVEVQQAKLTEAAKAAKLAVANGGSAETRGATGDEVLQRKYEDLKVAYQDLKVAKDEAVWMALCSTETGLEALRKVQIELICAKQEASQAAAHREEGEEQLIRAVRIARSRGQKVKVLAAANAEMEERLVQESEENARLREELERAKKAALKKAPVASTASVGTAKRRANPAAFASDAAPSSSEMDIDEDDGDSSFAAHAVKTSSRATSAVKSKPSSLAAAKTSSSATASSSGLREKIIARAEPQPRKRPAYPVLEDDSDKESEEEAQVSDEQDEGDEQAEVENDSFVVLKPSASKAAAAPARKTPAAAAAASKPKTTSTPSASTLASKRSSVISSTLTASTAASRIRAQEVRVAQSPPAAAPVKKALPAKTAPVSTAKSSTVTTASKTAAAAKAAAAAAAAAEADALDATKKKKRRLLGGGGASANPLIFGSASGAAGGAAGKKLIGSGAGAGGEDEEAENLLNPTLDLPVTLSPVKGFGGKLGMGMGAGAGRFGLGKAGGAKSMFG